ncbi:metallophosphoesterase [Cyclobacterium marinum]|uniref:Metallophosphoesterase n=1 Tax=Cyclobacterium marinum (strain ATCC 25205 / DSM 745 / LMG 13164 / NCIMB 1802) TaxID=880070 RepID=G0IZY0_CYCMS|nr:metallophosphoesterase [Cyclobacterium marinum]AEL26482.1 metallophosphoesterase [Cyclobacterium marinum DSM 745]
MNLRFNVCLFLAVFVFGISCSKKKQEAFNFVQLCDTQLGMGGYAHDLKTFKQAVVQINEMNPDFAVICGDLVHNASDSSYADFLEIMESFDVPCHVAPGNHDVGNVPNDSSLSYYRKTIGPDYFNFDNKGYSFVVTNTQLWKEDVADESKKHDHWFGETLGAQKAKNAPIFVIGHYPLFLEGPDEEEKYFNLPPAKRAELLGLFKENGVVAYLSGHTHELVINDFEGIQFVSGETTSKNFDKRPFGFRIWEVSTDTIQHHFVPLTDADE